MASDAARLIDLVCTRYPGTKPSEYLGVEDEYSALALDIALAMKFDVSDIDRQTDEVDIICDRILSVCKILGAKGLPKKIAYRSQKRKKEFENKMLANNVENIQKPTELPTVAQAIKALGGKNVVVEYS